MMQFHATSPMEFRCHPYAIHWTVKGWTVWNMSRRKACLGRDLTMSEALAVAEKDKNEQICSP